MRNSEQQAPALPWLVADIGGTNARFGWVDAAGAPVGHVRKLAVADYAQLADAVQAYLGMLASELGIQAAPRHAAFAVATPVVGDEIRFTNSPWSFSRSALQTQLRLDALLALNDFEALALSLPTLGPGQLRPIGAPPPKKVGAFAVVGPGTGLGVGGVMHTRAGWVAVAGEGGHATLATGDEFEDRILQRVRVLYSHVSGERLLSGIGLPTLYRAVAEELGGTPATLDAAGIIERGLDGRDVACDRTIDVFCALLGGFAGNVALTLGARGGVYIGGGIVPRLGERFFTSAFRERFDDKGRFRPYMQGISTALITDTLVALAGAAFAIEQLGA